MATATTRNANVISQTGRRITSLFVQSNMWQMFQIHTMLKSVARQTRELETDRKML